MLFSFTLILLLYLHGMEGPNELLEKLYKFLLDLPNDLLPPIPDDDGSFC